MIVEVYSIGTAHVLDRPVKTTDIYKYDDETFEYHGVSQRFDAGEKAKKETPYTFESIKNHIMTKGKEPLILQKL